MVQQVTPYDYFPSGDRQPLVDISFNPAELASRYGLEFEQDIDDLDWYQLAAIQLPDGSQVWFIRYRGDQENGTTVYIDSDADFVTTKELLMETLEITEEDLLWTSPRVEGFEQAEE